MAESNQKMHPNGGGTRKLETPSSKMPEKSGGTPHQGADLSIPNSKMPRSSRGQRQSDPYRK